MRRELKNGLKWAVGQVLRWTGVVGLNYHRIGDGRASQFDRGLWSATAEGFDAQLRWLKANFDVIPSSDIDAALRRERGRHVVVTFDDGYVDNYTTAFPILKEHGVPATFFVATGFVDQPRISWWDELAWMVRTSTRRSIRLEGYLDRELVFDEPDREMTIRALLRIHAALDAELTPGYLDAVAEATGTGRCPVDARPMWMTWDMLREMQAAGMTIGGHTVSHQLLSRMSPAQQWLEISTCRRRIADELGPPAAVFSYPVGTRESFNAESRACLERAGVKHAFTYYGGFRGRGSWDALDIRRIAVEQDTTLTEFQALVLAPWLSRVELRSWLGSPDGRSATNGLHYPHRIA